MTVSHRLEEHLERMDKALGELIDQYEQAKYCISVAGSEASFITNKGVTKTDRPTSSGRTTSHGAQAHHLQGVDRMKHILNILFRTSEFRGDHTADVAHAVEPLADETVDQLVARLGPSSGDVIEIRSVFVISA